MKKIFLIFLLLSFISNAVICQNVDNLNKSYQINPSDNIQVNDIPNQQFVMNNPQQAAIPQQAQVPVQIQVQKANLLQHPVFSNDNGDEVKTTVNIGSSNNREKNYTSYSYSSNSSKSKIHFKKSKINLHKVHILRKFRNECPLLSAKTYKNLFTSKKHKVKHCFIF